MKEPTLPFKEWRCFFMGKIQNKSNRRKIIRKSGKDNFVPFLACFRILATSQDLLGVPIFGAFTS